MYDLRKKDLEILWTYIVKKVENADDFILGRANLVVISAPCTSFIF